jgi:hypothetical protein
VRVRSIPGELGLEEGGREERMSGESGDARIAGLVGLVEGGEAQTMIAKQIEATAVGAHEQWHRSMDRSVPMIAAAAVPGVSCPAADRRVGAGASGTNRKSSAPGLESPFCMSFAPQTLRANSRSACWKPEQVPRNGTPFTRPPDRV